ncbi:patatin-like phospholipase family protein [Legionella fallonii]|uniref:Esterase of the alpha-beta hydrolase superfamily, Patatin-like phospholipase domain protein n=1 Tax=Legionella fallonii LLAP-10 TaxID=1212491 RepID=A0A098G3N4_9GAMM|nr:patatin-like phospholipase family protein [Legionella fallonii]CEG56095.1 Esterase of the alpha-beta hydrolase superfamily, Patatin-like phospholipase domain protein [Legionella fallonii LLAP-10]
MAKKKSISSNSSSAESNNEGAACPIRVKKQKEINLAVQGGGAHGAFAWGVIDRLLEDDRISIEGISGTSAGSLNAAVLAYGLLEGSERARERLENFWWDIAQAGVLYNPCKQFPWETFWYGEHHMDQCLGYQYFQTLTRWFSPYQLNPHDFNPLKDVLLKHVDFSRLQQCQVTKLFLSATNVRTGQVRVFHTDEITSDVVLASACLPYIFKAVEIDGEYYWDGGYTGNPALFPFFYYVENPDIMIIHVNPIERPSPPTQPSDIFNRINEISFNSALLREFRSIAFVHKLIDEDWLKDEYKNKLKYVFVHSISADTALQDLSTASKLSSDWNFLLRLRNRGMAKASEWLARNYDHIGVKSTLDLRYELTSDKRKKSALSSNEKTE